AARPEAVIDWVVEEAFAPLLASAVEGLARVIPIAQRRWRKSRLAAATRAERAAFRSRLREEAYDLVIDFQGLIKSALVARAARLAPGGERVTYANASEACGYEWPVRYLAHRTVPMPWRLHIVERYRRLAAGALAYPLEGVPVYALRLPRGGQGRELMFVHGTTRLDNEWPEADWIELGRRLIAQGWTICLPQAGEREASFAARVAAALGPAAQVLPRMSLGEMPARMARCGGVIGVDSGLSHLAVALDLPHVQLFSQPRVFRAGPTGRPHQLPVGGERAPTVDEVWAAWCQVQTLLAAQADVAGLSASVRPVAGTTA
ncbi:MAG: hypothetical protein RL722_951, partial [Pseudomonadota bacterium]